MPQDQPHTPWWKISFTHPQGEELAPLLVEQGASGVECSSPTEISLYLTATPIARDKFIRDTVSQGFALVGYEVVPEKNWVQISEEVHEPLTLEKIFITPVSFSQEGPPPHRREGEIFIMPGMGFGTGHHATTALLIKMMQKYAGRVARGSKMLDLGTGSGILALTIAEIFSAPCDAIDTDPLALDNAQCNLSLNPHLAPLITLRQGSIEQAKGNYSLIVANIYAEVLCELTTGFHSNLSPEGLLFMSGIMASLWNKVETTFVSHGWQLVEKEENLGWVAVLFKRGER